MTPGWIKTYQNHNKQSYGSLSPCLLATCNVIFELYLMCKRLQAQLPVSAAFDSSGHRACDLAELLPLNAILIIAIVLSIEPFPGEFQLYYVVLKRPGSDPASPKVKHLKLIGICQATHIPPTYPHHLPSARGLWRILLSGCRLRSSSGR